MLNFKPSEFLDVMKDMLVELRLCQVELYNIRMAIEKQNAIAEPRIPGPIWNNDTTTWNPERGETPTNEC